MPGPESLVEPELAEESLEGPGPVAAAIAPAAFPSGPSLLSCWAVLGDICDSPPDTPSPEPLPLLDALPFPEAGPVGLSPPAPGMLSWYWSTPEFPGGTT